MRPFQTPKLAIFTDFGCLDPVFDPSNPVFDRLDGHTVTSRSHILQMGLRKGSILGPISYYSATRIPWVCRTLQHSHPCTSFALSGSGTCRMGTRCTSKNCSYRCICHGDTEDMPLFPTPRCRAQANSSLYTLFGLPRVETCHTGSRCSRICQPGLCDALLGRGHMTCGLTECRPPQGSQTCSPSPWLKQVYKKRTSTVSLLRISRLSTQMQIRLST